MLADLMAFIDRLPNRFLKPVGDILFGKNQRLAWNLNDTLIRTAIRAEGQFARREFGYINANDRKIAIFKFENIRATLERGGHCSVGMGIGTKSAYKHAGIPNNC